MGRIPFVCGVLLSAGCGGGSSAKLYFLDGRMTELGPRGQLAAVERSGLGEPADVLLALLDGSEPDEARSGLVTTIGGDARVSSIVVSGETARVDLTGAGRDLTVPNVDGAAQIVYTLTELPGIRAVVLRNDGVPCCVYRQDGRPGDAPLTRRDFRGWGGEPCAFRATPAPTCGA